MGGDKAAAPAAAIDDGVGSGGKEAPLGVKLRRAVSVCKGGGLCTPPPSWKLEEVGSSDPCMAEVHRRSISARKLGAGLWEIQDPRPMPLVDRRGSRIAHQRRNGKAPEDGPDPSTSRRQEDWVKIEFLALCSISCFFPGSDLLSMLLSMSCSFYFCSQKWILHG